MRRTNTQMIANLKDWFPEEMHIVSYAEIGYIERELELYDRDVLSLRNLRDTVVLMHIANSELLSEEEGDRVAEVDKRMREMDKMSAITSVIDNRIRALGEEA